mgnify:CR=1 FL=1
MTAQQIAQDFKEYMAKNGGSYNDWYVGITSDINQRLFTDHDVRENGDAWIHAPADTNNVARSVEKYFLDLGCDGGTGGGDYTSKTVYTYKKNSHTNP